MAKGDLHTRYRPETFDDVVGQDAVCKSVQNALKKGTAHSFIFTGPSGVGKTTLARIVAREVGCTWENLIEVDAATNTGIDAMRDVAAGAMYAGLGSNPTRVYIIDEAHALSKGAWQSLLKIVEEPPSHVYWVFCTTEPSKIPDTIVTRCNVYPLSAVSKDNIFALLQDIADDEKMDTEEDVLYLIAERCGGSPRRALTMLSRCEECSTRKEAAALLNEMSEEGEAVDLCRALVRGERNWAALMKIVGKLQEINPESVRIVVMAYMTKVAMGSKGGEHTTKLLNILDAFADPYPPQAGTACLLISLGRVVFS